MGGCDEVCDHLGVPQQGCGIDVYGRCHYLLIARSESQSHAASTSVSGSVLVSASLSSVRRGTRFMAVSW